MAFDPRIIQNAFSKIQSAAQRIFQPQIQSPIPNPLMNRQVSHNFTNPISQIGKSSVGQAITNFQNRLQYHAEPVQLPKPIRQIPATQGLTNIFVNTPLQVGTDIGRVYNGEGRYNTAQSNLGRTMYDIAGKGGNIRQAAGDIAGVGLDLANYLPAGQGSKLLGSIGKQGFKQVAKQGLQEGAKLGGLYGFGSGLQSGRDITNPLKYAGNLAANTAGGAALGAGAGLGGAIAQHGINTVTTAIANAIKKTHPQLPEKEVANRTSLYMRNKLGQYAGITTKDKAFIPAGKDYPTERPKLKIHNWMDSVDRELGLDQVDTQGGRINFSARIGLFGEKTPPKTTKILDKTLNDSNLSSLPNNTKPEIPGTGQSTMLEKPIANVSETTTGQIPQMGQTQGLGQKMQQAKVPGSPTQTYNADSIIQKVKDKADALYTASLDRFHPISKLGKQAGQDQTMRNALTGYYGSGSIGKYHTDFELSPILKSVDANDLRSYTVAQRDVELAGRGIKGSNTGEPEKIIEGLKTKYGGNISQLDQGANKLYDYQKNMVQKYLVDTGIISKENFAAMTKQNQKYVPFKRVMDTVDEYLGGVPQTKGAGSVGSQNVIKGIKGSSRDIKDPLESIIENTYKIVGLGQRNKVAQTIVGLQDKLPQGMIQKVSKGSNSTISLFKNGKVEHYQVPPEVADAAKGMSEEAVNTFVKILGYPTKVFRATATGLNPEFAIPNTARDLQSAFVNAGINPLKFVSGLAHYMKKDEVYQEFLKSGGQTSRISLDQPFLKQNVKDLTGIKGKGLRILDPRRIKSVLEAVGQASEQPTRIAAFQKGFNEALKKGLPIEEARARGANMAQEATVNFARRGSQTQPVNMIYAFLNARAQGVDRLIRSAKNNPVGVSTRLAFITAAPALALYAHNRGFESYNDPRIVPDYEKQNNFIFMLSDQPVSQLGGAQYIKIPKGDVGKLANPLEAFLSYAEGKGGDVGKALGDSLMAFSPVSNVGDLIPTALRPGVENATNHNFFTDRPIVSESQKNYPAQFQTSKTTPAIYKEAGRLTNQSPNMIQNAARGYLTGFARLGEMATQPLAKKDTYSGKDINQTPILRRFLGGAVRSEEEQQLNDLYQQKGILNKVQDIKTGVKYGNIPIDDGIREIEKLMKQQPQTKPAKTESQFGIKKAGAAETAPKNNQDIMREKVQEEIAKAKIASSGQAMFLNNKVIYQNANGNASTIDLNPPTKGEGIDAYGNKNWNLNKALDVYKADIPQGMKQEAYKKLGVDGNDMEYAYKASKSNDIKSQYAINQAKTLTHDQLLQRMVTGRVQSITGDLFATDGVLDALNERGLLTDGETKMLKQMKLDKNGNSIAKIAKAKKGRKLRIKAGTVRKFAVKQTKLKIKKVKLAQLKFKVPKEKKQKIAQIKIKKIA